MNYYELIIKMLSRDLEKIITEVKDIKKEMGFIPNEIKTLGKQIIKVLEDK